MYSCDRAVDVLAGVVARVDHVAVAGGLLVGVGHHEPHGGMPSRVGRSALGVDRHAPGRVDARADLEDQVVDRDLMLVQPADLDDRFEPLVGRFVDPLEAVIGQNAVFARQRNDVRGDAHDHQVQQGCHLRERKVVLGTIGLRQLESDAAPRQFLEGIVVVRPLGIEHRRRPGDPIPRQVVVADDEIDAQRFGILDLFARLDPAVQRDDQLHAGRSRGLDPLDRDAVALGVAVGDVERQLGVPQTLQERIHQCHGRRSVHVVVAVDHHFLLLSDGLFDPGHRPIHVLHPERIVQVFEPGFKKLTCFLVSFDAPLNQEARQNGSDPELDRQMLGQRGIRLFLENPSFFCVHTFCFLYCFCFLSLSYSYSFSFFATFFVLIQRK